MAISINTNMAATRASHFLASNHANLQKSLDRLSSGKRITQPADDAGGLAVAMKLNHSINGLRGASSNISNAISFLQVQDGILSAVGDIVARMGELKSMSSDVTKSSSDIDTYNSEFGDLQKQLFDLSATEFNGIAIFEDTDPFKTAAGAVQAGATLSLDVNGQTVDIHQSSLLSALTVEFDNDVTAGVGVIDSATINSDNIDWSEAQTGVDHDATDGDGTGFVNEAGGDDTIRTIAVDTDANRLNLDDLSQEIFTHFLENVATLRATNGGQVKRLQYSQADMETQISNMTAAHGRIMDVDIASESSNLAKQQILVQASAAMTAQANTSNDVALMLLR